MPASSGGRLDDLPGGGHGARRAPGSLLKAPAPPSGSVSGALNLYRDQPLRRRAYLQVRRLLLPLPAIEHHLPRAGAILDAACGYGLLANYVALAGPERTVHGVDVAPERIAVATMASRGLPNARFRVGDLRTLDVHGMDAVLLIDALHYFPETEQCAILARCRRALVDGGLLVCRDAVAERSPRFWWNWLHESIMAGAAFTASPDRSLHFLPLERLRAHTEAAGFAVERVVPPRRHLPYTDTLLVARATGGAS